MASIWKRSAAWVTSLKSDLFTWARLKLTALYLLITVLILVFFSTALYSNLSMRFRDDFGRHFPPPRAMVEENFYDLEMERLLFAILSVDAVMFVLAAALSFSLAGYTLRPIKEALDAQKAFSADASHELRTPLAVMRNDVEVLLRGKEHLSPAVLAVLHSNLDEITGMSAMTEQLLDLSRGNWVNPANFEKVNLSALVSLVGSRMKGIAEEKDLDLIIEAGKDLFVMGDTHNLERMIKNILQNAISYTEQGLVRVSVYEEGNRAVLSVKDTGVGIAREHLPKIFDRFYKVDHSRTGTESSGSGLGLAIVQQIVNLHNGSVQLKSDVGKGTEVLVRLPKVSS